MPANLHAAPAQDTPNLRDPQRRFPSAKSLDSIGIAAHGATATGGASSPQISLAGIK